MLIQLLIFYVTRLNSSPRCHQTLTCNLLMRFFIINPWDAVIEPSVVTENNLIEENKRSRDIQSRPNIVLCRPCKSGCEFEVTVIY